MFKFPDLENVKFNLTKDSDQVPLGTIFGDFQEIPRVILR